MVLPALFNLNNTIFANQLTRQIMDRDRDILKNNLDEPETSLIHRNIILNKPFLKQIYLEWYEEFIERATGVGKDGIFLELGSGGGFLKSVFPQVITSDIQELPNVDLVCNAEDLPFDAASIACIMMLNVFHHIPRPYLFLAEAERTLVEGGKIVMTEPANTFFSRFVYRHFHHEPFDPEGGMEIAPGNPLSLSNQAFPYIYFQRERPLFDERYRSLRINSIRFHTPLRYILSGGLSHRALVPMQLYGLVRGVERMLSPLSPRIGLFCTIEIEKVCRVG
jgi:SAM-dependent methyltransferase